MSHTLGESLLNIKTRFKLSSWGENSINIWKEQWLPFPSFKIVTPQNGTIVTRVSDLIY